MIFGFVVGFLGMQCIQSALRLVKAREEISQLKLREETLLVKLGEITLEKDLYEAYIYDKQSGYWYKCAKMRKDIDSLTQVIKTLK